MHNETKLMELLSLSDSLDDVFKRLTRIFEGVKKRKGKEKEGATSLSKGTEIFGEEEAGRAVGSRY
jgi:hypothetical protein